MSTARLLLMRHAKSDWSSGAHDDFARPLNERGVRDARRMGRWLVDEACLPSTILCSPAQRTRDTLRLLAEGAGQALDERSRFVDGLYLATAGGIREVLRARGADDDVMVLGHNPGLEELLAWLLPVGAAALDVAKPFPTAAIYVLAVTTPLSALERGSARVVAHQRPKHLEA